MISQDDLEKYYAYQRFGAKLRADLTERLKHDDSGVETGRYLLDVKALLSGSAEFVHELPAEDAALQEEFMRLSATDPTGLSEWIDKLAAEARQRARQRIRDLASRGDWGEFPHLAKDAIRFVVALSRLRAVRRGRQLGHAIGALSTLRSTFQAEVMT